MESGLLFSTLQGYRDHPSQSDVTVFANCASDKGVGCTYYSLVTTQCRLIISKKYSIMLRKNRLLIMIKSQDFAFFDREKNATYLLVSNNELFR